MAFRRLFGKVIKIVVTRGQVFRLKYTKFYFGWGPRSRPRWRSLQRSPDGSYFKGRERRGGKGKGAEEEGREREGREREKRKCRL